LIIRKLENMGRRGDLRDAPQACADLQRSLQRLCEDLIGFAGPRVRRRSGRPRRAGPNRDTRNCGR
jgi:hypothetical protein